MGVGVCGRGECVGGSKVVGAWGLRQGYSVGWGECLRGTGRGSILLGVGGVGDEWGNGA